MKRYAVDKNILCTYESLQAGDKHRKYIHPAQHRTTRWPMMQRYAQAVGTNIDTHLVGWVYAGRFVQSFVSPTVILSNFNEDEPRASDNDATDLSARLSVCLTLLDDKKNL